MKFGDYVGSTRYAQLFYTTYYTDALNILRKCSDISQFLVVSDDIDRSKSFASTYLPDDSVRFISSTSPLTDFAILSSSKYLVTANSTFSLTASSIPSRSRGIIVYPKKWFTNTPPIFNINNTLIHSRAKLFQV